MRVRVHSRSGQGLVGKTLHFLQIVLTVVGLVSLSVFLWLQFERFYYDAQYLRALDRLAATSREAPAPESPPRLNPLALPMPSLPQPPQADFHRAPVLVDLEQPSSAVENTWVAPWDLGLDPAFAGIPAPMPVAKDLSLSLGGIHVLGRLRVSRLGVEVAVLEGIDDRTLRRGAGWIPGTARPGEGGNVGIAAHRDTFFRPLREIRAGDRIELETLTASRVYVVRSVSVVRPETTAVLRDTGEPAVTLVTCFPFDYWGPAPRRYIVQAVAEGRVSNVSPRID